MALSPTSPVTGSAVTGLTSPTYTITEDQAEANKRRWIVTALGGTQTGVETHSVSSPFSLEVSRPNAIKVLPRANVSGNYSSIPMNEYRVRVLKGTTVNGTGLGSVNEVLSRVGVSIQVPAGFELASNDPEEAKAMLSFLFGFLHANASGLYDLISTGVLK